MGRFTVITTYISITLLIIITTSVSRSKAQLTCNPAAVHEECLLGCHRCAKAFGRRTYSLTACCAKCEATRALLIDDGPERCSIEFLTDTVKEMIKKSGQRLDETSSFSSQLSGLLYRRKRR